MCNVSFLVGHEMQICQNCGQAGTLCLLYVVTWQGREVSGEASATPATPVDTEGPTPEHSQCQQPSGARQYVGVVRIATIQEGEHTCRMTAGRRKHANHLSDEGLVARMHKIP